jgi:hypothetical protein
MKYCTPDNPAPAPLWRIDEDDLDVCPKGLVTHESAEWLRYYSHYCKNILPAAGGLLNQTMKYVSAMELIEATKAGLDGN